MKPRMKQYIKNDHFIMAIPLSDKGVCTELSNIEFALNRFDFTRIYSPAIAETIRMLEEGNQPLTDQRWEISKP